MRAKRHTWLSGLRTGARRGRAAAIVLACVLIAGVAVAASMATLVGDAPAQAQPVRPNVVVVQTDDQRADELKVMPKVRRLLRRQGTTFVNQFATHPRCCPSRASYLTGQYSHNHGVEANSQPKGGYPALDHRKTLPVWLQRAGYVTGHIGKYMNGYTQGSTDPPGWTEIYASIAPSTLLYGYRLRENGTLVTYGEGTEDYQTDVYAEKAARFIRRSSGGTPFFLSVNPSAPHSESSKRQRVGPDIPRNPRPAQRHYRRFEERALPKPRSFNEKDVSDKPRFVRQLRRITRSRERRIARRHRSRLESLLAVDDAVGRVVRTLRQSGELGSTIVILTSDNGFFNGEHRFPRGKTELYEESVRVPLVIRGPGFPRGVTRRQLTGNIDLAPTILDAAGAGSPGRRIDGISLLPLARDGGRARNRELLLENGVGGSTGIRTKRWSYIEHDTREKELYDLRRDPLQLRSKHQSKAHRKLRRNLSRRLHRLETCAGRSCR